MVFVCRFFDKAFSGITIMNGNNRSICCAKVPYREQINGYLLVYKSKGVYLTHLLFSCRAQFGRKGTLTMCNPVCR